MPATMSPSQKANKLRMGRGRVIVSATIPIPNRIKRHQQRQDENRDSPWVSLGDAVAAAISLVLPMSTPLISSA